MTEKRIVDYRIIRGMPAQVEIEVLNLINSGYSLNGPLAVMEVDGTKIVVQGLIQEI